MICASCNREISDLAIICPICNTQFAFSAPGQFETSNPNLYEIVEVEMDNNVEESSKAQDEIDNS